MDSKQQTLTASVDPVVMPRVLARGQNADKATLIAALLSLGLWDSLSISDREAWCERAEVLDTVGGRLLFATLQRIGMFPA